MVWYVYIRVRMVGLFAFLTDTRLPGVCFLHVTVPPPWEKEPLFSQPRFHTNHHLLLFFFFYPAALRSTTENGAVWEMEAIYNRCPELCCVSRQSESPASPPSPSPSFLSLPSASSMLMSHNYLLTAQTNYARGKSDIKSKLSQVIEPSHRERACAASPPVTAAGVGVCVCVRKIWNDNRMLISRQHALLIRPLMSMHSSGLRW